MLRTIRVTLALLSITALTLLFLDITGTCRELWGWMAKIQFIPAILALNLTVVVALTVMTLLLGRVYCSVICPLGVMQDIFTHIRGYFKIKGKKHNRFNYKKNLLAIRTAVLVVFIAGMAIPLTHMAASLIEPYSAYGHIVSAVGVPVYDEANNLLADIAENHDSYLFYRWFRSPAGIVVTTMGWITLIVIGLVSFFYGRSYCNTVCPVGTILGFVARFSLLKPWIDTSRCNGCTKCARNCKAMCIDAKNHKIDYTRCVACMDCINQCSTGAIRYGLRKHHVEKRPITIDRGRRMAMLTGGLVGGSLMLRAADNKLTDGGYAKIITKEKPGRKKRIVPPGAVSVKNLANHCTGCQLCIANCPNEVLRPSVGLTTLMQPVMEYEKGFCRPECTACSSVCPTGAIKPLTVEEKSAVSIGLATVERDRCVSIADGENCGNCARHCPAGAIMMLPVDEKRPRGKKMPVVNESICIGCGACENFCPVSPISAIRVEGRENHIII